jgi:hypothetical protein
MGHWCNQERLHGELDDGAPAGSKPTTTVLTL